MKLFRKITALALTLVIVAMLGISASAASFSRSVPGEFGVGVGTAFNGNLTTREAWASAVFHGAEENDIELEYQHIAIDGQSVSQNAPYTFGSVEDEDFSYGDNDDTVGAYAIASDNYRIQYAQYSYEAYYVANGVVDCYMNDGPVTLTNS